MSIVISNTFGSQGPKMLYCLIRSDLGPSVQSCGSGLKSQVVFMHA